VSTHVDVNTTVRDHLVVLEAFYELCDLSPADLRLLCRQAAADYQRWVQVCLARRERRRASLQSTTTAMSASTAASVPASSPGGPKRATTAPTAYRALPPSIRQSLEEDLPRKPDSGAAVADVATATATASALTEEPESIGSVAENGDGAAVDNSTVPKTPDLNHDHNRHHNRTPEERLKRRIDKSASSSRSSSRSPPSSKSALASAVSRSSSSARSVGIVVTPPWMPLYRDELPPLRVLMCWHAHMLNPYEFDEDCEGAFRFLVGRRFPLHEAVSALVFLYH
jgi:hypothetical protein